MTLNGSKLAVILSLVFFVVAFSTIRDYGISWDEPTHFKRGQAYLHYFLTGEKHYTSLNVKNRSFFQNDKQDGEFWLGKIGSKGHPPVNGILASVSNYIFYQKLSILGDTASYHLFNVSAASILVFAVAAFMLRTFGVFAAIVSFLALSTYPLFWSESHFNIKDPALAAFFSGFIWTFYESVLKRSYSWLILSFTFLFLALGTKFNTLFLPLIILPWLIFYFKQSRQSIKRFFNSFSKKYLAIFLIGPIFVILAFIISWPSLWSNFPPGLSKVFIFYKDIGTAVNYQPGNFYLAGFNTFALKWIIFTTPPLVLILSFVGIFSAWINRDRFNRVTIIWLLWLIVPIARVSVPGTTIYGGVRQIMEFIPALALLTGLGAWQIAKLLKGSIVKFLILSAFLWPTFVLIKIHPNENVYFNQLISGLSGAQKADFPSWGNSYGNVYKQGVDWINANAEFGVKATLLQSELQNVYPPSLRPDINFSKDNWSGHEKGGEYIMELTFNDTAKAFKDKWDYVNNSLIPVYEARVEGVPILKIWKNDLQHSKQE